MPLQVEELIYAYLNGFFPMADATGEISWYAPDPRAIIPLENYKPSKSLRPVLNKKLFDIRINKDFRGVMEYCAKPRFPEDETWISNEIIDVYCQLHSNGFAHSVEAYEGDKLVGGLYGVSIGGVFFGESMFHLVSNASKVAFHYLIEILRHRGFILLDTQFINDNVLRYGAIEIPKVAYEASLKEAIAMKLTFVPSLGALKLAEVMA
ncbi:leucyl/phenylalanyl-tRNA--protein transferase [Arcticibacterium luteifluviistationis]|uniref:Leucyl/phenylalanyl-tRNA--protein transferase n=1 Tax=Arcticibacterium luteifluviistationis TaxID=1784714 RepID=A0A2Z4G6E0_9BACT|nr:leucyl/phenylalanyl-tRNA--protein transferase [Arcticibacterium luteifluviistationis]AWV96707.1 leucyl/phenylalanyl-tRNA--protein transferase [Arcticibacterium luteifluviistationis]